MRRTNSERFSKTEKSLRKLYDETKESIHAGQSKFIIYVEADTRDRENVSANKVAKPGGSLIYDTSREEAKSCYV